MARLFAASLGGVTSTGEFLVGLPHGQEASGLG